MNIRTKIQKYFYPDWPEMGTMQEWGQWHKKAKQRPIAYWLTSTMPRWFSVKGMQLHDKKMWFKYRLQKRHKYHLIDTKLEPNYYEIETRMLHGMFSLLVDYVEIEKASLQRILSNNNESDSEAGLRYLDWEIGLVHDDYPDPKLKGKPTPQAETAKKVKELYLWWTVTRPNRKDLWDDEYVDKYMKNTRQSKDLFDMWSEEETDEEREARTAFYKRKEALEDAYDAEDTEMLIRLIKIRKQLWT